MTNALTMGVIVKALSAGEMVVRALEAGCGLQLMLEGFEQAHGAVLVAAQYGTSLDPNAFVNGVRRPIKTDRNILLFVVLSIVTCDIYAFYFIYKLAQDINIMCVDDGKKTGGLVAYILLSYITCGLYSYYWQYEIANRLYNNAPHYGLRFDENGTTILLWCVVGLLLCGIGPFIAMYFIIRNTNEMAVAYNARYVYGR